MIMLKYLFQRHNSGRHVVKLASTVIRHYNSCCSSLNWKPCCKTMQKEKKRKCSSICKNYTMTMSILLLFVLFLPSSAVSTPFTRIGSLVIVWSHCTSCKYSKKTYIYKFISGATHLYKELVHNHAISISQATTHRFWKKSRFLGEVICIA